MGLLRMSILPKLSIALITFHWLCSSVYAETWKSSQGINPQGLSAGSMHVEMHEFALIVECNEETGTRNQFKMMFFGPGLPRLFGEDGQEEKLSILFILGSGVLVRQAWQAYYFDGGPGDQAWIGNIQLSEFDINAFARASNVQILNVDGDLVYEFGANGTSAAIKSLKGACKFTS